MTCRRDAITIGLVRQMAMVRVQLHREKVLSARARAQHQRRVRVVNTRLRKLDRRVRRTNTHLETHNSTEHNHNNAERARDRLLAARRAIELVLVDAGLTHEQSAQMYHQIEELVVTRPLA